MNGTTSLAEAFPPGFEHFGLTLRPPEPEAVPLPQLLGRQNAMALIATYGASLCCDDRRAVLSMWSQYYFLALLPATIAAAVTSSDQPDVTWVTSGVILGADGTPNAVCLPDTGRAACADCPAMRLTPLLREHLVPCMRAMAEAGLPEAVGWSNAGHVVLWALRTILGPGERITALSDLLQNPIWVDGTLNPLQQTLCHGMRTVCCLRHRIPGMTRCNTCPVNNRKVYCKHSPSTVVIAAV